MLDRTPRSTPDERVTMSDTLTPAALAEEIGITPKSLRGYLRKAHTRPNEVKNTSWLIDAEVADAARAHFAKQKATTPAEA